MDSIEGNHTISGGMIASIASASMIVGMAINFLVLILTLNRFMILKRASVIYVTNFIVVNFLFTLTTMPLLVGLATADKDDEEEEGVNCHFIGFMLYWYSYNTGFTITLISIDRFLFYLKPKGYQKRMKAWLAILILVVMWFITSVISIPSYTAYEYNYDIRTCVISETENSNKAVIGIGLIVILCNTVIISITSVSTVYLQKDSLNRTQQSYKKDPIYGTRSQKATAMFIALVVVTGSCYALFLVIGILNGSGVVDQAKLPYLTYLGIVINMGLNPIIQLYFRKELNESIVKKVFCCKRRSNAVAPQPQVVTNFNKIVVGTDTP